MKKITKSAHTLNQQSGVKFLKEFLTPKLSENSSNADETDEIVIGSEAPNSFHPMPSMSKVTSGVTSNSPWQKIKDHLEWKFNKNREFCKDCMSSEGMSMHIM